MINDVLQAVVAPKYRTDFYFFDVSLIGQRNWAKIRDLGSSQQTIFTFPYAFQFFNICTELCLVNNGEFSLQKVTHITVIKCYRGTCATNKPTCFADGSSSSLRWLKKKKRVAANVGLYTKKKVSITWTLCLWFFHSTLLKPLQRF